MTSIYDLQGSQVPASLPAEVSLPTETSWAEQCLARVLGPGTVRGEPDVNVDVSVEAVLARSLELHDRALRLLESLS